VVTARRGAKPLARVLIDPFLIEPFSGIGIVSGNLASDADGRKTCLVNSAYRTSLTMSALSNTVWADFSFHLKEFLSFAVFVFRLLGIDDHGSFVI
jgi:hypothetical protein